MRLNVRNTFILFNLLNGNNFYKVLLILFSIKDILSSNNSAQVVTTYISSKCTPIILSVCFRKR